VRHQSDLKSAAEHGAMHCRDDRLRRALHEVLNFTDAGAGHGLAELTDVSTRNEGLALADEDDRRGRRQGACLVEGGEQALANLGRQRVHRRRIHGDDRDPVFDGQISDGVDGGHDD